MSPMKLEEETRKDYEKDLENEYKAMKEFIQQARIEMTEVLSRIPWRQEVLDPGAIVLKWFVPFSESAYWSIKVGWQPNGKHEYFFSKYESIKATSPWEQYKMSGVEELMEAANDQFNEVIAGTYLKSNAYYQLRLSGKSMNLVVRLK